MDGAGRWTVACPSDPYTDAGPNGAKTLLGTRAVYFFFFPAPCTMAVFLWALAAATLMNLPVMALRPMPGAFVAAAFFAAFFVALFLTMLWRRMPGVGVGSLL